MRHVVKWKMPATVIGSPKYHRDALLDLKALVQRAGMPTLFVTLTADEVSGTRWEEINDLETFMERFAQGFKYSDVPVECAAHFIDRFKTLMRRDILCTDESGRQKRGIFGNVTDHLVRYEVQGRGSLHVHMLLWLHPDDIDSVSSEISGAVPAEWDASTSAFREPTDPLELELYRLVLRKQMHKCTPPGEPGAMIVFLSLATLISLPAFQTHAPLAIPRPSPHTHLLPSPSQVAAARATARAASRLRGSGRLSRTSTLPPDATHTSARGPRTTLSPTTHTEMCLRTTRLCCCCGELTVMCSELHKTCGRTTCSSK
jgi:hypothetical protein